MFTEYKIKWINNHILIDDEQGLLIDTGSPTSFHSSGVIKLCGQSIKVPTTTMGVSNTYLQEKISTDIYGLIGTDIIASHPTLFNLQRGGDFIFMDDDTEYMTKLQTMSLMGLYVIFLWVDGNKVKMIFDTGAPISYIRSSLTEPHTTIRQEQDFSPLFGDFNADIIKLPTKIMEDFPTEEMELGQSKEIDKALSLLGVDGIIGTELLKHYRIQINHKDVVLPPQGI